ncbi:serine-rich adhesin for platelets-like isoform X2 [Watersipora subatra]
MTVERHQEMQVLRKQACITEVRLKSKSRKKEFLNRVERSLEEIQRETSEKEMSPPRRDSLSESSQLTSTSYQMQLNNNSAALDTDCNARGADTDSPVPGETIHIKPAAHVRPGSSRRSSSLSSRKESTSTHTSDSEDIRIQLGAAKIHRRRTESSGSTGSETSGAPSDICRYRSKSNSSVSSEPTPRVATGESRLCEYSPLQRTGSDGGCKLRRSGSERALKRSGSERGLKRTGSGDIPTAIMSDSTPRIHRRAGSGDMSHLHSPKQPVINKLTRSYDMSLRSLMSEELNVKVQPSKDGSPNELTVELAGPSHNLLSPKYSTGKDSAAVKLLTRPATPTIKKERSPSKESGPPQPVKAIHTLPPSQPMSRENTFDSSSHKSLVGSDTDTRDDKFVDNLVDAEVPKSRSSYHRRSPSPHQNLSSPLRRETSPLRTSQRNQVTDFCRGDESFAAVGRPLVKRNSSTSDDELTSLTFDESAFVSSSCNQGVDNRKEAGGTRIADSLPPAQSVCYKTEMDHDRIVVREAWEQSTSHRHAAGQLPQPVMPADNPAQQWLVDKVSQLHSSGQVNIEDWLQNAPDSVKQKLSELLPSTRHEVRQQSPARLSSPTDLSVDDTLRNSSPFPESQASPPHLSSNSSSSSTESDDAKEKGRVPFVRSNSYTLPTPSMALLLSDKANPSSTTSDASLTTFKYFPSPDKSSSLPVTHNRVETRPSHPTNISITSDRSRASLERLELTITANDEVAPSSPNAIERNKAIASKSYIVERPSAALLDSLNDSQKSIIEAVVSSAEAAAVEENLSTASDGTHKNSHNESRDLTEPGKPSVQRRLDYLSLGSISSNAESGGVYHSLKYNSTDMPKRAHLQRYLQQMKSSDTSRRKEAWSENSNKAIGSQSKLTKSAVPSHQSVRKVSSGNISKVPKHYEKGSVGRRKSSPAKAESADQTEDTEAVSSRMRKELALLKSKYPKKLSPRTESCQRPSSAEPATCHIHQPKEREFRPSTAAGHNSTYTHEQFGHPTTERNLMQLKERLHGLTNKHLAAPSGHLVKSFAEKEATPISTGYVPFTVDESISEYSSYGAIHSVTHPRPSTAHSAGGSPIPSPGVSPASALHRPTPSRGSASSSLLFAVIKGHLCRRLFATCKVQTIVKTIHDCHNLLSQYSWQPAAVPTADTLQDVNFQQRLLDQLEAALLDIHEIFFELPVDKRIALIQQSEIMQAKVKAQQQKVKSKVMRKSSIKEQQPPKRRISPATQKVMDRKKVQKASADTNLTNKSTVSTTLKKAVFAPTFAANSPQRASISGPAGGNRGTLSHH